MASGPVNCRRTHPSTAHNTGDSGGAVGPGARPAPSRSAATLMKVLRTGSGALDAGVGGVVNVAATGWFVDSSVWPAVAVAAFS